jgi:hypothetical protein
MNTFLTFTASALLCVCCNFLHAQTSFRTKAPNYELWDKIYEKSEETYCIGINEVLYQSQPHHLSKIINFNRLGEVLNNIVLRIDSSTTSGINFSGYLSSYNDSFLIAGVSITPDTDIYQYQAALVLINKKLNGDTVVYKRFNLAYRDFITNVFQLPNREMVAIMASSKKTGNTYTRLAIEKIDSLGNTLWSKVYSSLRSNADYFPLYSTATADGGFAVAISEEYFMLPGTPLNPTYPVMHVQVLKLDSLGNKQWIKSVSPPDSTCFVGGIVSAADSSLFIVWTNPYSNLSGYPNNTDQSIQLTKMSLKGDSLWRKNANSLTSKFPIMNHRLLPKKAIIDKNGDIVVAGWQDGNLSPMFLYKVSQAGNPLWYYTYRFYDTFNTKSVMENNIPYDLIETSDGGYLVAGEFYCPKSNLFPDGIQHGFLWKFDGDGCFNNNPCNMPSAVAPLSTEEGLGVKLYPNPATNTLTLQISTQPSTLTSQLTYFIQNTIGQTLLTAPINDQQITIDVSQLPKGVYIFTLLEGNNPLKNEKLVK